MLHPLMVQKLDNDYRVWLLRYHKICLFWCVLRPLGGHSVVYCGKWSILPVVSLLVPMHNDSSKHLWIKFTLVLFQSIWWFLLITFSDKAEMLYIITNDVRVLWCSLTPWSGVGPVWPIYTFFLQVPQVIW